MRSRSSSRSIAASSPCRISLAASIRSRAVQSPARTPYRIAEVLLVYDWGPDCSDEVIRELSRKYRFVLPVWLMRNAGQHAATAAGIASTSSDWVVTLDEDGQHDPAEIGKLLDVAVEEGVHLVYGVNETRTPHPWWRNATSALAKSVARLACASSLENFTSFRLIEGSRARSACAYMGTRTFLDVALTWTIGRVATRAVRPGDEGRPGSGYGFGTLLSHFWTLALSSGTRPLRIISLLGLLSAFLGVVAGIAIGYLKVRHGIDAQGWASVLCGHRHGWSNAVRNWGGSGVRRCNIENRSGQPRVRHRWGPGSRPQGRGPAVTHLLIGHGQLGSAVSAHLPTGSFQIAKVPWTDHQAAASSLKRHVASFLRAAEPGAVYWCAGLGVVGTPEQLLKRERELLQAF